MNKFRASYTVLRLWETGRWEDAVKAYFKLEQFTTRAMAEGKEYHEKWKEYIDKNKKLPKVFGGKKLKKPITEKKIVVQLYDWLELVFIADLIDEPVIYDFKTGTQSSGAYIETMQLPVYAMGLTLSDIFINEGNILHYNQHIKKSDQSKMKIDDSVVKQGLNWVETLAGEMHEYFRNNKLYDRFNKASVQL